jgi:hypothetical protein
MFYYRFMIAALLALTLAAERIPVPADGRFEARPGKCVRVVVESAAEVRVNGLYAGEAELEIDITGYLRAGWNEVLVPIKAFLLFSPPVYLQSATSDGKTLRVTVVNTTEHTMQVELNREHQFTVSPGTSRDIRVADVGMGARIRATSDGLDLSYEDDMPVASVAK